MEMVIQGQVRAV